ncbi:2-hydroxy-6-oxononadienedioate/2-hydroxy-6-oxononatrienedioate hydrolase-like isoform X2 [Trifolium pratense]|nr:2-hydroxy-6-oxononadienedioate/2-hydroxy-6-oxononatrienedioate hydrolase-like isoform X2 [Trifolium pratense]
MTQCFSLTETRNWCYRSTFTGSGLRSTIIDLKDGTIMHCWIPKIQTESKPNLLLIHGLGANALWQWGNFIRNLTQHFNIYVPDLVFFGGSYTTRPERTEAFQAECVMKVMELKCVRSVSVVGLSYGGFVAYSMGVKYREFVEKIVICGSGVCLEEKDIKDGIFPISDLDEAANILVPQTPQKLRELVGFAFFRAPLVAWLPSCLLLDFINAMCREYVQEKKELIKAIAKDRNLSELPKISKPTLIIWGEQDLVFPLELGHRLKRACVLCGKG